MMKILAAAQDAGAANALTPVLRELARLPPFQVETLAVSHASRIFSKNGVAHQVPPAWESDIPGAEDWAWRFFQTWQPDLLLLGTGWGVSLDKWLLRWAEGAQVPSLALIDHWCHYRERFMEPTTGVVRLPSRIGVMEPFALEQAVQAGLPRDRLVITGQPYLEALIAQARRPELLSEARALRKQWLQTAHAGAGAPLILFASERYPENPGVPVPSFPDYTETEALEGLIQALIQMTKANRSFRPTLVVKLHPKESLQSFELGPLAREWKVQVAGGVSAWPCILAADLVVGMTSMILLETALIGKAAVSFQPGVEKDSPFVGTQLDVVPTAANVERLAQWIGRSRRQGFGAFPLEPRQRRVLESLSAGNAFSRIVRVLFELNQGRTAMSQGVFASGGLS